jgi:hypothetical protein
MTGGAVAACTWRRADPDSAARDKVFSDAVNKQRADMDAARVAGNLQRERDQAAADARANALPPLLEAAQDADAKQVKGLLALGADRRTLNKALLLCPDRTLNCRR